MAFLGPSQSAICVAPKPLPPTDPAAYLDLARFARAATAAAPAVAAQAQALFENAARQMDNALQQVGGWVGCVQRHNTTHHHNDNNNNNNNNTQRASPALYV